MKLSARLTAKWFRALVIAMPLLIAAARAPAAPGPPPATQMLMGAGGQIAYDDTGGAGPAVICVPGMGDVRAQYRFLAPILMQAGYRVVTMDLRGLGESSTGWSDYSAAAVGGDIVALARHLDAPRVFIVGNSMAAAAAVWAAAEMKRPRVAGIVLIGPFVRDLPTSFLISATLSVALRRPWGPSFWSMYYKSLYPTAPPADLSEYRVHLVANLKEAGRFEALQAMVAASKAPCEERLGRLEMPVMLVMGTKDPDFSDPGAEAQWIAQRTRARVVMVAGAGHYPHAEMPGTTGPEIVKFIGSATGGIASGS